MRRDSLAQAEVDHVDPALEDDEQGLLGPEREERSAPTRHRVRAGALAVQVVAEEAEASPS